MAVDPDFSDLLAELNAAEADYLIVGAHAVMVYTSPRYTKDLDILVRPTLQNATRVLTALDRFGAGLDNLSAEDLSTPGIVFMMGVPPHRIDILTRIAEVDFEDAWQLRTRTEYGGIPTQILGLEDLLRNKLAVGRPTDLIDAAALTQARDLAEE